MKLVVDMSSVTVDTLICRILTQKSNTALNDRLIYYAAVSFAYFDVLKYKYLND